MSFKNILNDFYLKLEVPGFQDDDIKILDPYQDPETKRIVNDFFAKYYDDDQSRFFLIGINPGRFGGGLTGLGFTDPINLEQCCKIPNNFDKKHELSSVFIYQMIEAMGGPTSFFGKFFFSSVFPLGLVKDGKNLNYYEITESKSTLEHFIVESLKKQIELGGSKEIAFCIGMGENYKYFKYLNSKHELFKAIDVLPHPRWVLQYRRKRTEEFVNEYVKKLQACI